MIDFLIAEQVPLGMLLGACLFSSWDQRRDRFVLRMCLGSVALLVLHRALGFMLVSTPGRLLCCTVLLCGWELLCFEATPIAAVFAVTCAYTVQHITSKLAFMLIVWLAVRGFPLTGLVLLAILTASNVLVCVPVYLLHTRNLVTNGRLMFNSVRTVFFAALFILTAVFLSSVLEENLDMRAPTYLTSYLSLNAFCILFAVVVLSIEITNCSVVRLETEKDVLERLLEKDRLQYERAREDMEKINIRYHDLKQQYARVSAEERAELEEEMRGLNLRYLTGNKALDIVITQKAEVCAQKDIQLVCSADGEALGSMRSYHVYSLFGNALDNAIECLERVDDRALRAIRVNISRAGDMVLVRVENYTPAEPETKGGEIVTTKEDRPNHGFGLKSIRGIAEKYGGSVDFFVRDHVFYLVAALPCEALRPAPAA